MCTNKFVIKNEKSSYLIGKTLTKDFPSLPRDSIFTVFPKEAYDVKFKACDVRFEARSMTLAFQTQEACWCF